jgi:hypothetical protein
MLGGRKRGMPPLPCGWRNRISQTVSLQGLTLGVYGESAVNQEVVGSSIVWGAKHSDGELSGLPVNGAAPWTCGKWAIQRETRSSPYSTTEGPRQASGALPGTFQAILSVPPPSDARWLTADNPLRELALEVSATNSDSGITGPQLECLRWDTRPCRWSRA